jgi:hypothetical protein
MPAENLYPMMMCFKVRITIEASKELKIVFEVAGEYGRVSFCHTSK